MNEPSENSVKAWSRDYKADAFYFSQDYAQGSRLVAWSPEPEMTKQAFYEIVETFPPEVDVLLKIEIQKEGSKSHWDRYRAKVDRWKFVKAVQSHEVYVFSDGMHQICIKDPRKPDYFAFDEHGVFFVYSQDARYPTLFQNLGFAYRYEEPIYAQGHFHHVPPKPEQLEAQFVSELGLLKSKSDI